MHKPIIALAILLLGTLALAAQTNEQAPIIEREFAYRDWTLKNVKGGGETNLRRFAAGKKLVMVVYWAPWCLNWRHDIEFVNGLHSKYSGQGLSIIGVGQYDSRSRMQNHIEHFKLAFPSVYETETYGDRLTSVHYQHRTAAGDTRKWGTPWYVFLDPAKLEAEGDVLTNNVTLVNGDLIQAEAEAYIRKKLSLGEE
jgi:hypothetical protein